MEDLTNKLNAIKDGLEQTIDQKIGLSVEKNMGSDFKNQLKGEVNELVEKHVKTVQELNSRIDSLEMYKQTSMYNAPKTFASVLKD